MGNGTRLAPPPRGELLLKLTRPERDTLITLIRDNLIAASYYGNRQQYLNRLQRLFVKLGDI
jgi:hypothetical protein